MPKKSTTDAKKTASKIAIHKTAKKTGHLIGNKTADKITKKYSQNDEANNKIEIPKERYISPEERQQIIDELRLI